MRILQHSKNQLLKRLFGTLTRVETRESIISLTFDDGPNPQTTPKLLDILERHQARATFFMVGCNAAKYPELVRRVAESGHVVANHSWDHASFPYLNRSERRHQLTACAAALEPYGQKIFRPPYGNQTLASYLDASLLGYQVITWSLVAHDWLNRSAQQMSTELAQQLRPGSIVLFHDGLYDTLMPEYVDRQPMLDAVESILQQFSGQYRYVTVPDLLSHGKACRQYWQMKAEPSFLNGLHRTSGEQRHYQG